MLVLGNGRTRADIYLYYPICAYVCVSMTLYVSVYLSMWVFFFICFLCLTFLNTGLMPKGNSHFCLVSCLSDLANYPTDCPFCKCFHFRKIDQTTTILPPSWTNLGISLLLPPSWTNIGISPFLSPIWTNIDISLTPCSNLGKYRN